MREPAGRELRSADAAGWARLREVPALLRTEPDSRRFLSARLLASAARGVLPLYIVSLGRQFRMSGSAASAPGPSIFALAQSGSTLAWGSLSDRTGSEPIFQLSSLCGLAGAALLLVVASPTLAALTYALVGASLSRVRPRGFDLVLEFGTERERRDAASPSATHRQSWCPR